jgi:hypothetical protein
MTENEIATIIVDAAFKIHKRLGPDPGFWSRSMKRRSLTNSQSVDYNYADNSQCPSSMKTFEWTLGFEPI